MYFAQPCIPSTDALKRFGASGLSTSAITATWISLSVIPMSVAFGFSVDDDCAPAANAVDPIASVTTMHTPELHDSPPQPPETAVY